MKSRRVPRSSARARPGDSTGSALLLALLVMVVVTLLGLTYLFQADTESLLTSISRWSEGC